MNQGLKRTETVRSVLDFLSRRTLESQICEHDDHINTHKSSLSFANTTANINIFGLSDISDPTSNAAACYARSYCNICASLPLSGIEPILVRESRQKQMLRQLNR
jgi:hypothetical protein